MCAGGNSGTEMVVRKFHDALARSPDTAVAVAAIKVKTNFDSLKANSALPMFVSHGLCYHHAQP